MGLYNDNYQIYSKEFVDKLDMHKREYFWFCEYKVGPFRAAELADRMLYIEKTVYGEGKKPPEYIYNKYINKPFRLLKIILFIFILIIGYVIWHS